MAKLVAEAASTSEERQEASVAEFGELFSRAAYTEAAKVGEGKSATLNNGIKGNVKQLEL